VSGTTFLNIWRQWGCYTVFPKWFHYESTRRNVNVNAFYSRRTAAAAFDLLYIFALYSD